MANLLNWASRQCQSRPLAPSTAFSLLSSAPCFGIPGCLQHRANGVQRWQHQQQDGSRLRYSILRSSSKKNQETIQGYTPANYISYSDFPEHACRHMIGVTVRAPVSVCFDLWNDWARLVDFLDLIAQIGLDPDEPDMGLFQCYYRWGRMPVMEIVFLARKSHVEVDKLIQFETVWGLPAKGQVEFIEDGPNTTVVFRFEHQMPVLLVDLKVGVLNMETHLKSIFAENMEDFKQLAELLAQESDNAPPRRTAEIKKTSGTAGAPQATPSKEPRPWAQSEPQALEASSSSRGVDGGSKEGARGGAHPRASPTPSSSQQQQQQQPIGSQDEDVQQKQRGRPRSRKPSSSATPPPHESSSSTYAQQQGSQAGPLSNSSSSNGAAPSSGSRSRRTPARSSSPAAVMGHPSEGPVAVSSKGRRSRSAASRQQQ